ncbi:MAG: hypothetical protein MUE72_13075 [Chitinophagaceae bacterium]|jgi:hypothetical protein|nr:hypothetical protein [Chitinophagaceae bacterium]
MHKQNLFILPLILVSFALLLLCSCNLNSNRVSITIKDYNSYYQFKAKFNRNKTERVKQCLNKNLIGFASFSVEDSRFNETITLDGEDEFKLRFSPGTITIKFNKQNNSEAAYIQIKNLCAAVKQEIEQ